MTTKAYLELDRELEKYLRSLMEGAGTARAGRGAGVVPRRAAAGGGAQEHRAHRGTAQSRPRGGRGDPPATAASGGGGKLGPGPAIPSANSFESAKKTNLGKPMRPPRACCAPERHSSQILVLTAPFDGPRLTQPYHTPCKNDIYN